MGILGTQHLFPVAVSVLAYRGGNAGITCSLLVLLYQ